MVSVFFKSATKSRGLETLPCGTSQTNKCAQCRKKANSPVQKLIHDGKSKNFLNASKKDALYTNLLRAGRH